MSLRPGTLLYQDVRNPHSLCWACHLVSEYLSLFWTFILFSSVQLLSCAWVFVTPWTAAHQASLSITTSWILLKLMSIELVMPCLSIYQMAPLLYLCLWGGGRILHSRHRRSACSLVTPWWLPAGVLWPWGTSAHYQSWPTLFCSSLCE